MWVKTCLSSKLSAAVLKLRRSRKNSTACGVPFFGLEKGTRKGSDSIDIPMAQGCTSMVRRRTMVLTMAFMAPTASLPLAKDSPDLALHVDGVVPALHVDGVVPRVVPENVTVTVTGDDGVAAMVPNNEMTNLRVMPNNHMVYPWDKDVVTTEQGWPCKTDYENDTPTKECEGWCGKPMNEYNGCDMCRCAACPPETCPPNHFYNVTDVLVDAVDQQIRQEMGARKAEARAKAALVALEKEKPQAAPGPLSFTSVGGVEGSRDGLRFVDAPLLVHPPHPVSALVSAIMATFFR